MKLFIAVLFVIISVIVLRLMYVNREADTDHSRAASDDPIFITTNYRLPDATLGSYYCQQLIVTGTPQHFIEAPVVWFIPMQVADESRSQWTHLPHGITLGVNGTVCGTPDDIPETAHFWAAVSDARGLTAIRKFTITVRR